MPSLSGNVAADRQAGALLAADQDLVPADVVADELEADRRLQHLQAVVPGDGIDEVGGGDGAGDVAVLPLDPHQVVVKKGQDVVRLDEGAVLVDDAVAVGVAVGGQTQADIRPAPHQVDEIVDMGRGGFRRQAAEIGVAMVVERHDLNPRLAQQGVEVAATGPVHRIDGEGHARTGDGGKVDQFPQPGEIGLARIDDLDQAGPDRRHPAPFPGSRIRRAWRWPGPRCHGSSPAAPARRSRGRTSGRCTRAGCGWR